MKRKIAIIIFCLALGLTACVGEKQEVQNETTTDVEITTEASTESPLKSEYGLRGGSSVNNDTTGGWTVECINKGSANDPTVWALDYYNEYWDKDAEGIQIKGVVNFANNTTTQLSVTGNILDVCQYDYVKGEEHDADLLYSGTLLSEWHINIDTGDIEKIQ